MIAFTTDATRLQMRWNDAVAGLAANIRNVQRQRVLIEGGCYAGIWLECAPLEGLLYADLDLPIAIENHRAFFNHQRPDGQLPCYIWFERIGWSQIQMVVPIAATAWELYQRTRDDGFLAQAYKACATWDGWLVRHRDTRGTGLCEAFCEFDTGHDNSMRWHGLPRSCPADEARNLDPVGGLPYLAPDLTATVYGGRVALAAMAAEQGLQDDAARWRAAADRTKAAFFRHCWDAEDACCYDIDRNGKQVRMRTDTLTRVLGEGLVDAATYAEVEYRHLLDPRRFGTPYPFPSVAVDDAAFDHSMRTNSWGGPSQALTALRAYRWLEHYNRPALLMHVLSCWRDAIVTADIFGQQIDPWSGRFTETTNDYSPAMLVLLEAVARLHGVHLHAGGLAFNCRLPAGARRADYRLETSCGDARLVNIDGLTELSFGNGKICTIRGVCRVETDKSGAILSFAGTEFGENSVTVSVERRQRQFTICENQVIPFTEI